jgi:hypothetical protein
MEILSFAYVSQASRTQSVPTVDIPSSAFRMSAANATNQTTHISSPFSNIQRIVNVLSLKTQSRAILATMTSIALKTIHTVFLT